MKIIAITGSIGCGKTTIAQMVRNEGYVVFDIDAWVRRLYWQPEFIDKIMQCFDCADEKGKFNKRKLRNLVFNDNKKLKKLESIIHPYLERNLKKTIRHYATRDDLYFIDVALLFEMGWDKYCDFIIVADVDDEVQKCRVMKRDNISAEDFYKINNVQINKQTKIKMADEVVDTGVAPNLVKLHILNIIEGLQ